MDIKKTTRGDIGIKHSDEDNDGNKLYDLITISDYINVLVRRAVETPLRYIAMWSYSSEGLDYIDEKYGNGIYFKLSEPGTNVLISGMRQDVINALVSVEDYITDVSVETNLSNLKTLYIYVNYKEKETDTEKQTVVDIEVT
jgi:hypothetical protein